MEGEGFDPRGTKPPLIVFETAQGAAQIGRLAGASLVTFAAGAIVLGLHRSALAVMNAVIAAQLLNAGPAGGREQRGQGQDENDERGRQ